MGIAVFALKCRGLLFNLLDALRWIFVENQVEQEQPAPRD